MICTAFLLWNVVKNGSPGKERTYTFSQFLDEVRAGNVTEVTIANGNQVTGKLKNNGGVTLKTVVPTNYPELYKLLEDKKVSIDIKQADTNHWLSLLVNASPFILLIAFWIFVMRQMQPGGNNAPSF